VTLARVQVAKKDFTKARGTLRALGRRRDELPDRDRTVVEELQKQVQGK